ncbi:TonB-dependent receptor plug domain-containing protein [Desulfonema limicola]|nr:TonB-dependent receptor [Desulfonema limicola]
MINYRNFSNYLFYKKICPVFIVVFFIQAVFLFTFTCQAVSCNNPENNIDFTEFSLEELKNIKITSASKKPEKVSKTAAAVFVISNEDICRSGATSIPEILRMVPGVQVARISATEWAVNMRDVNQLFANKLLVLMDGRSIYNHVFSGVFWDIHDTVIEDIERIEVIRGPGAALWGANAVNGVINIITKRADKTQGGLFSAIGGNEEGSGTLRYGGSFASAGYYRIYTKYFNRGQLFENNRNIKNDPSKGDWRSGRTGFRIDWEPDTRENILSFQGEAYDSQFQTDVGKISLETPYFQTTREISRSKGGHILGRWQYLISNTSDSVLQFYFDFMDKDFEAGNVKASIFDIDFQHQFSLFEGHKLLWGINWRMIIDSFKDSIDISIDPETNEQYLYSFFIQDKIELIPEYLTLSIGSKFEHNDYTGTEIQPDVRLSWTPLNNHAFWGSVSRAVRVPSRFEHDAVFNEQVIEPDSQVQIPTIIKRIGSKNLDAESLTAYELGYSFQPQSGAFSNLWINIAGFYHDYDNLVSLKQRPVYLDNDPVYHQVSLLEYQNNLRGESYGLEVSALWHVIPDWQLQCSYTFLEAKTEDNYKENEEDTQRIFVKGANPENQISVRSSFDIHRQVELDLWLRYVGSLSNHDVDDYTALDARISWKPIPLLKVSLAGQNLLEKHHFEYSSLAIERSFYFKLEWFF